jgi:hypothetical protein
MLGSEPIQVRLLHFRIMVYELSAEGGPIPHWWASREVVCFSRDRQSACSGTADADDKHSAARGMLWGFLFELGLAIPVFLCWGIWA